jgi:Derlin-2/3
MNAGVGVISLWDAFSMVISYVWSKYFPEVMVSFLFGIRFKARYLPLALLAMDAVMGGDVVGAVLGIIAGHLYYFVREEWPGGYRLVQPPRLMYVFVVP